MNSNGLNVYNTYLINNAVALGLFTGFISYMVCAGKDTVLWWDLQHNAFFKFTRYYFRFYEIDYKELIPIKTYKQSYDESS